MPIQPPVIDDRRFEQLVEDTLARAPVHTPEWTNFNQSDPGVTLVQLFSFVAENVLYRANRLPEANAKKFLQLLRVPLAPAAAASGLVAISNDGGAAETTLLPADLELRAGTVPFRTQLALDVLPVQALVVFKRKIAAPSAALLDYYRLLYASYQLDFPADVELYETVALDPKVVERVDLAADTVDASLWIALLARPTDQPDPGEDRWKSLREQLAGRTLNLGLVPALDAGSATLLPGNVGATPQPRQLLHFELPSVPADGRVPRDGADRPAPSYRALSARTEVDLLSMPGIAQITLPGAESLRPWPDIDPLEAGAGDMPPTLEDTAAAARLITWVRIRAEGAARARIQWAGINAVPVRQIERVGAEVMAGGDGTPDQRRRLARAPVLPGSVSVLTQAGADAPLLWRQIDDLAAAAPEVPVSDWRSFGSSGAAANTAANTAAGSVFGNANAAADTNVFELDAEAGELRFGDGLRGRRLPRDARVQASYAFCMGAAGNVAARAINSAPQLPSGFSVSNPAPTWGGADAESTAAGEKQVKRHLQHRDRLVSVDDFEAIACRTPGVQIGRIEVLPAFHPDLGRNEPGAAPGVVTLLAIPRFDPAQPDAPRADRMFLNAICRHLDPRRLVTTELVVRGADYKGLWISVGVDVAAGFAVAEVVDAVKARLQAVLAPIGPAGALPREPAMFAPRGADPARGWPLRSPVLARALLAEVARVPGVTAVADVLLATGNQAVTESVELTGLELPHILGLSVVAGEPVALDALRGSQPTNTAPAQTTRRLPVPVVPESC